MDYRVTMEEIVNRALATLQDPETTPDHIKAQISNLSKPMEIQVRKGKPIVGGRRIIKEHVIINCFKSHQAVITKTLAIIGETALKDNRIN